MNYLKMFRDVGIMDYDPNFFSHCYFDIEHNCRNSSEALFKMIDEVYTDEDVKNDLSGFIWELKKLYKEVGINLGCLFMDRHSNKEIRLIFFDTDKLEMRKFSILNGYLDNLFDRIVDIPVKPDIENLFSGLRNRIALLQHDLVLKNSVPGSAINFALNSDEFREHSYFLIKTGFKYGFFWYFAFKVFCNELSDALRKYLPGDWQKQLI
jgi:hypothetical protein